MLTSCKKPIFTKLTDTHTNYLVVNGNITPTDTTTITLSRLVNVNDTTKSNPELNATVVIEGSQNGSYSLTSKSNGTYVVPPLNLSANQNYRIKITTSNGKQYASDFVPVKNSPPIDSISYTIKSDGLQINANTHDPLNNTHYYRWDYHETYIFHSQYKSNYIVVNNPIAPIVPRPPDKEIYECWLSDTSSNLVLASSAKLAQDIISEQLLTAIPSTSEKIQVRYSIIVKQYALTPDAYNYFTLLQKNTEQIGGIFDPQPSALTGNIHNLSDKSEPVIGFITAGTISQQRIFIDNSELPAWPYTDPHAICTVDTLLYHAVTHTRPPIIENDVALYILSGKELPIDNIGGDLGFTGAIHLCVDCTLRGTNKQPSFWK